MLFMARLGIAITPNNNSLSLKGRSPATTAPTWSVNIGFLIMQIMAISVKIHEATTCRMWCPFGCCIKQPSSQSQRMSLHQQNVSVPMAQKLPLTLLTFLIAVWKLHSLNKKPPVINCFEPLISFYVYNDQCCTWYC